MLVVEVHRTSQTGASGGGGFTPRGHVTSPRNLSGGHSWAEAREAATRPTLCTGGTAPRQMCQGGEYALESAVESRAPNR